MVSGLSSAGKAANTLLGPEATPGVVLGRWTGDVVVVAPLGGGVWCLFNWIVVASI